MADAYHELPNNPQHVSPTQNRNTNGILPIDPDQRPSLAVRRNLAAGMTNMIYDSVSYNTVLIAISILKVVLSASVLLFANTDCNKPIHNFLIFMLIHDIAYCLILLMNLTLTLKENDSEARMMQVLDENREFGLLVENRNYAENDDSDSLLIKRVIVNSLTICSNIYWYLLFVFAHFLYFQSDSNCRAEAPTANALVLTYICFGYIYIGIPIIFVIIACVCLPVLLLVLFLFSKDDQVPAKKNIIKSLQVTKYSRSLPGSSDCSICMMEYQDQDNIIQLKCSPLHYFHEQCLKKWLSINGLCPICRTKIGEDSGRSDQEMDVHSPSRQ